jgi:hypothetical protein
VLHPHRPRCLNPIDVGARQLDPCTDHADPVRFRPAGQLGEIAAARQVERFLSGRRSHEVDVRVGESGQQLAATGI